MVLFSVHDKLALVQFDGNKFFRLQNKQLQYSNLKYLTYR